MTLLTHSYIVSAEEDKQSHVTSLKSGSQKMSVGNRTALSAFGSITAQMTDGMTIALSQFGESGSAPDGRFITLTV